MKILNVYMLLLCLSLCVIVAPMNLKKSLTKKTEKDDDADEKCITELVDDDWIKKDNKVVHGSDKFPLSWDLRDDVSKIKVRNENKKKSCTYKMRCYMWANYVRALKIHEFTLKPGQDWWVTTPSEFRSFSVHVETHY